MGDEGRHADGPWPNLFGNFGTAKFRTKRGGRPRWKNGRGGWWDASKPAATLGTQGSKRFVSHRRHTVMEKIEDIFGGGQGAATILGKHKHARMLFL
eukprot:19376-Prymnesium_polylepis.1